MNTWEVEHAQRVGAAVQRFRKTEGVSAQSLSDRTEELGLKMTRQAIADLENGRRRYVTTAELLILAAALNVPPVVLLYPNLPDGMVEQIPGQWVSSINAVGAFVGEGPLTPKLSDGEELVRLSRDLVRMKGALAATETLWDFAERSAKRSNRDVSLEFADLVELRTTAIAGIVRHLREIPGAVVNDEFADLVEHRRADLARYLRERSGDAVVDVDESDA